MENRIPLIVDSSTQKIKELPVGDNLDLTSSSIVGVVSVTATSFHGDGSQLTGINATSAIGGIGSLTQLQVTGVSTFTNGPVLVGSATSTGTASQSLQVTGGAYISGSVGIGTTNPTATLDVTGTLNGSAFESYELDDISSAVDGLETTFIPRFNYDRVTITNPFRLMVTVNGIPQSAFINNTNYVYQSNFLGSNNGFTIDNDSNIKFTESVPIGSQIVIRVLPSSITSRIRYYPFNPADILLGY